MNITNPNLALARMSEKDLNQQEGEFIQRRELEAGKRRRWMATSTLLLIIAVSVAVAWDFWDKRIESQINKVFLQSPQLVRVIALDRAEEGFDKIEAWLRTLVISGDSHGALESARRIGMADLRSRAIVSIAEALNKLGKTDEAQLIANEALESARKINVQTSALA